MSDRILVVDDEPEMLQVMNRMLTSKGYKVHGAINGESALTALEETESALVEFGRAQARRDYLRDSARFADEAVTLANDRYRSGIADFLQVLDAQRTQLSIQEQLAFSEARCATALVAVYKALGGGWEGEAPAASTAAVAPSAKPGQK